MKYRDVEIVFNEGRTITEEEYVVRNDGGLVYAAISKYGNSFARTTEDAIDGAKRLIDSALGKR